MVLLAAAALVGCGGSSGDDAPAASPSTPSTVAAGEERAPAAAADCGAEVGPPALPAGLDDVASALAERTGVAPAPAHEAFEVRCDNLGGVVAAAVPAGWGDTTPGPEDPPQAGFTAGPDLLGRVEAAPVVGVGAQRFVGDAPAAAFVNENNAEGSLENGARTLPRRGDSVADGCDALEPVAFRVPAVDGAPGLAGEVQPYVACDGEARAWLVAAGFPDDGAGYRMQLIGQALTTADVDALVRALASLRVVGDRVPPLELPPPPAVAP